MAFFDPMIKSLSTIFGGNRRDDEEEKRKKQAAEQQRVQRQASQQRMGYSNSQFNASRMNEPSFSNPLRNSSKPQYSPATSQSQINVPTLSNNNTDNEWNSIVTSTGATSSRDSRINRQKQMNQYIEKNNLWDNPYYTDALRKVATDDEHSLWQKRYDKPNVAKDTRQFANEALKITDETGSPMQLTSGETFQSYLDRYNKSKGSKIQQRLMLEDLQNKASRKYFAGNEDLEKESNEAKALLSIIEARGEKDDNPLNVVSNAAFGAAKGLGDGIDNFYRKSGAVEDSLVSGDISDPAKNLKNRYDKNLISEEKYIDELNKLDRAVDQMTGGMNNDDLLDKLMRSAGTGLQGGMLASSLLGAGKMVGAVKDNVSKSVLQKAGEKGYKNYIAQLAGDAGMDASSLNSFKNAAAFNKAANQVLDNYIKTNGTDALINGAARYLGEDGFKKLVQKEIIKDFAKNAAYSGALGASSELQEGKDATIAGALKKGASGALTSSALQLGGMALGNVLHNSPKVTSSGVNTNIGLGQIKSGVTETYNQALNSFPLNRLSTIQKRNLTNALKNGTVDPVYLGKLRAQTHDQLNNIRRDSNVPEVSNKIYAHPNAVKHMADGRIHNDRLSPSKVSDTAYDALHSPDTIVTPGNSDNSHMLTSLTENNLANRAVVGGFNNDLSLKTTYPLNRAKAERQIKNSLTAENNLVTGPLLEEAARKVNIANNTKDVNSNVINDLNPTGGISVNYSPEDRAGAVLGDNITTYDRTAGLKPDDKVTIYRGVDKAYGQDSINPGDFITTDRNLAEMYAGDKNVISMEVNASDILDSVSEPLGDEYIYKPKGQRMSEFNLADGTQLVETTSEYGPNGEVTTAERITPDSQTVVQNTYGTSLADEINNIKSLNEQQQTPNDAGSLGTQVNNVPLQSGELTKGNLYGMTKIGARDYVSREINGHREHVKVYKNGKQNVSWEVRGADGRWYPETKAAYTWHTQKSEIDEVANSEAIQNALLEARKYGQVLDYIATRNSGGDWFSSDIKTEVSPLHGDYTIDGGIVRNPLTGEILGNHVQVTPFGIVQQIGGKLTVTPVDDINEWNNKGGITDTFSRILEKNAPSEQKFNELHEYLVENKRHSEANYRSDLANRIKDYEEQAGSVLRAKPSNVSKKEFGTDIFRYGENKFTYDNGSGKKMTEKEMLAAKYGEDVAEKIDNFTNYTHRVYDEVLDEVNEVYRRLGREEVPRRKDYMTHLQEKDFLDRFGVTPEIYQNLTGIKADMGSGNRGTLPDSIVGRTEDFKPNTRYNPFFQKRRGNSSATDPFNAMETYLTAALYNKHMTEPTMRARSVAAAFRAASEVPNNQSLKQMPTEIQKAFDEYKSGNHGFFLTAVEEYANALAGKSTRPDRWMQDASTGTRALLKGMQKLQAITGSNKILGNFSSTLSQALNLPDTIRDYGVANTIKGVVSTIVDKNTKNAMAKSDFLKSRYTEVGGKFNTTKGQKVRNVISKMSGMDAVEKAFVDISWGSAYQNALNKGLKGREAIQQADNDTARLVGARGIGDMPEIYRSTIGKTLLQFTYETNESGKNLLRSGIKGAARYFVAAFIINMIFDQVVGRRPLPDPIGAGVETVKDLMDDSNDENQPNDGLQAAQRLGGELVSLNPFLTLGANTIPKELRGEVFGRESDFGRYDGSAATAQTMGDIVATPMSILNGDIEGTKGHILNLIPGGSQIKKTTQGINKAIENESNPIDTAKGAIFGKMAVPDNAETTGLNNGQKVTLKQLSSSEIGSMMPNGDDYKNALASKKSNKDNASYKGSMSELNDNRTIKLAEGDWKINSDGLITDKDGKVNNNFYKEVIKLQDGLADYELYRIAYDLPSVSNEQGIVTGLSRADNLKNLAKNKTKSDIVSKSISLAKSGELPDWVLERYASEEANIDTSNSNYFGTSDLGYAVMSSYTNEQKQPQIYDDISSLSNHDELIGYLVAGRQKSAANQYWVTSGILADLRDNGLISKDEYKWLNNISDYKNGNVISKSSSSSSGSSKKSKLSVPGYSIGSLPNVTTLGKNFASGAPEYSPVTNQGKGIVKGISQPKIDTTAKVEPLKRLSVRTGS